MKEETLKATLGRFKAFAAAAGVDIEGKDSDAVFSELQNRKVVAKVSHTVGRDNPEQTFAQVDRWLPAGTIEPHVTEEAAKHQGGKAPATAGPQPGARAAAPSPGSPESGSPRRTAHAAAVGGADGQRLNVDSKLNVGGHGRGA